MDHYAIIVAGGTGNRMKSAVPKQFAVIAGKPVLMHTLEAFHTSELAPGIVLVLHPLLREQWQALCAEYAFQVPHTIVDGGATRFNSVLNALKTLSGPAVVAIHDAVRPLVSNEVITTAYWIAASKGSAVTAVSSRDSVRRQELHTDRSTALNREEIYLVQTPQTFLLEILEDAYHQPYDPLFTDDASVVEQAGYHINLVEGSATNLKITFAEDLLVAELLLKQKNPAV